MSQSFHKSMRVTRGDDFTRTLRRGSVAADGVLVVFALARAENLPTRIGITIPKKTGNSPQRNHWKRLIRESYRTQVDQFPIGFDLVVRPKKDAKPDWATIQKGLPKLAAKAAKRKAS